MIWRRRMEMIWIEEENGDDMIWIEEENGDDMKEEHDDDMPPGL
jgi:hypothetical protein